MGMIISSKEDFIVSLRSRYQQARVWVRQAGRRAQQLQAQVEPVRKPDQTYVTAADRSIEAWFRERTLRNFPRDGYLGEESAGSVEGESSFNWVVDPIDGTASYGAGLPVWGISVGILEQGRPRGGTVYMPAIGTECHGLGEPAVGSALNDPRPFDSEDLLCVPSDSHRKFNLDFPGKTRSLGSTAYHMVLVLTGRAVGALLGRRHLWDLAAGWGMCQKRAITIGGVYGGEPNLDQLLDGKRAQEPLLMAPEPIYESLTARISAVDDAS